ncbi:methyl-accepting chemotaxis protein [Acinetobacter baumannii]|nr:methyl-accepting chemotaxis protein [Acinetobacter baumannii]RCU29796.1 methyl-accepting chemotaxis protein [Acinetobacter baumannii]RCU36295.1 methyl-accepting chemotaxis protein [Acinetobacter baumannii]
MKFFKYLVFIIITICSSSAFADLVITVRSVSDPNKLATGSSMDAACKDYYTRYLNPATHGPISNMVASGNGCYLSGTLYASKISETYVCPSQGYPVPTYFEPNTPIPLRACKQNPNGSYCVYDASDKVNPLVISTGKYQMVTLSSISSIPSPSCTPEFSKSTCDPKDPYGGCYQPPDDGCNRLADGSIYCPEGTPPPPIKTGCQNGATYCDMPPTGCGSGYVPGSFNGKQICVKNSNPPPTDPIPQPPEPDPTDPPDPNDPPPASSPPPAIPPESSTILRSILDAINAVNNKLTWVKDEIVNSVNNVSRTLGVTNQKLDAVNSSVKETTAAVKETTAAVNNVKAAVDANATTVKTAVEANADKVKGAVDANTNSTANKLNEVVNAINNKPVGGGGGGSTDVTPVVNAIEKQTTDFKDMMKTDSSDFDTSQYEKIGDASDDPRSLNAQSEAAGSLQALSNKLTFSNSACVQDFTVTVPIYGSLTVPLSQWCDLLALVKILLHLCTLMVAFKMLDSTVRAI